MAFDKIYKYTSCKRAIKDILPKGTLRASHPSKFNDPFDIVPDSLTPFNLESAWSDVEEYHKQAVRKKECLKPLREGKVNILPSKRVAPLKALAIEAWGNFFKNAPLEEIPEVDISLDKENLKLRINLLFQSIVSEFTDVKVLCACSRLDNLSLWSHYADEHKGVVLKLKVGSGKPPFDNLTKVQYKDSRPVLWTSPEDILRTTFEYSTHERAQGFIQECLYTKSLDWEKEDEVRMVQFVKNNQDHVDIAFDPADLEAVYFGSRIELSDKEEIEAILDEKYKSTRKYEVKKSKHRYELEVFPCE